MTSFTEIHTIQNKNMKLVYVWKKNNNENDKDFANTICSYPLNEMYDKRGRYDNSPVLVLIFH